MVEKQNKKRRLAMLDSPPTVEEISQIYEQIENSRPSTVMKNYGTPKMVIFNTCFSDNEEKE